MPDRFEAHYMKGTGMEIDIYSPGKDVICYGCGKKFAKDFDLRRHWRVPIPCQIHNCPKTFRDDKLRAYLNHHASEHCNDEQDQYQLQSYFRGTHRLILSQLCMDANPSTEKRKDLRHSFVPNLCVNKLGFPPESNIAYFGNMPSAAVVSSTEPWNRLGYSTVDTDVYTPNPILSAPETSIGPSPLTPGMPGLLNAPDVLPSGSQLTRLGTGFDCGRENLQAMRADGPGSYLREQVRLIH
jgi:hypothetical protein